MPEDELAPVDLSWFYRLDPVVQGRVLQNLDGPLPTDVVSQLPPLKAGQPAYWSEDGAADAPGHDELAPNDAGMLKALRDVLDDWWSGFSTDEQTYIVENRAGDLDPQRFPRPAPDGLVRAIHSAGLGSSTAGPHPDLVGVIADGVTAMFRAYVEMRTAE